MKPCRSLRLQKGFDPGSKQPVAKKEMMELVGESPGQGVSLGPVAQPGNKGEKPLLWAIEHTTFNGVVEGSKQSFRRLGARGDLLVLSHRSPLGKE